MGPLTGIKVVEITGIGPGPFAAMMLADMGADVVRVDRAAAVRDDVEGVNGEVLYRGRRSVAVDLKQADGVETVLRLAEQADALLEGFRPGVAERLGIGPEACHARNPRLVYGRMTGWGQEGPLAPTAGHDIDYIALAGALAHFGRAGDAPTPPINLVGDFGGGGMLLAFGLVCGILESARSGQGQVVDTAMVDGAALLMTMMWGLRAQGVWDEDHRGTNVLDTGAPFYDSYRTADGAYVAVGAIEPQFYAELLERLGLADEELPGQMDAAGWPTVRARFSEVFASRTRAEWCEVFDGSDACVTPVLTMSEASRDPHLSGRGTFTEVAGVEQPAPAPRFSRTPGGIGRPPAWPGEQSDEVLADWGFSAADVAALREAGAIR